MQISNQEKVQSKKRFNMKKSQILLLGSLLVFCGFILVGWNDFMALREEVYSDLKIEVVTGDEETQSISVVPVANNLTNDTQEVVPEEPQKPKEAPKVNYDKYLGVLEIPKISLKRGFYEVGNKYNDIKYNVTIVGGSDLPDVEKGNLILMAHSGDAYISFFAYLWKLNVGDMAYVTYNKVKYNYKIVDIYDVPKIGQVTIRRDYDKTTMTLITCTKDNDHSQTVYILEQV